MLPQRTWPTRAMQINRARVLIRAYPWTPSSPWIRHPSNHRRFPMISARAVLRARAIRLRRPIRIRP